MPFEEKGVPQHREAASSGTARRTPARWASRFREAGTPLAAGGGSSPMPTGSVDVIGSVSELGAPTGTETRSEEHTSELQSRGHLVCRLLLEKKKSSRQFIGFVIQLIY